MTRSDLSHLPGAIALCLCLGGCGGTADSGGNVLPDGFTQQGVTLYPATAPGPGATAAGQDLLTAGLGSSGLATVPGAAATLPAYADPLNPSAAELRRNAIVGSYRALVDTTAGGGFGTLYGPNVDTSGTAGNGAGMVPGREYVASLDDGTGTQRVTVVVQIPDSFSTSAPCLVLGPSSGSRGVYGAIATAGEWGLKHGCAVALTDAGKGVGLYDPADDTVNRVDGTRATRAAAGVLAQFAPVLADAARQAYNQLFPGRLAWKQAHSQRNAEKEAGTDTLAAASYALWALADRYHAPFDAGNVLTLAGSVGSGGAAVLRAAELDSAGLVKGVVAADPAVELPATGVYGIRFDGTPVDGAGKRLADALTYANLYQPCAAFAPAAALTETSAFNPLAAAPLAKAAQARCSALAAKGLVNGVGLVDRAQDALARLHAYGWSADHDQLHNAYYGLGHAPVLSAVLPMMYGRASVVDALCSTSFAPVDPVGGQVVPLDPAQKAQSFAASDGAPDGTLATVVYDNAANGAHAWQQAVSPSSRLQDFGLDNALCQRALVTGLDETGASLTGAATSTRPTAAQSAAVQAGIAETLVTGNLHAKPTLVVAGRSDALVPVDHGARAYAAYNRVVEGSTTQLAYLEVVNAQHFDALNGLSGFDTRFVPLHLYFVRAMDAMYAHLRSNAALPPSQVVRTTPRGGTPGAAPGLTAAAVPGAVAAPPPADQVGFTGNALAVPR